ncbi:MAG: pantoate--beta-alanine ligase [Paludibacteraceae bacterium]|nr:pantoate--beta-alanine ligase [Paludibacteraceae bacterium]
MIVIEKIADLQAYIKEKAAKSVGFVPTMGALHDGHISLITRCVAENDLCVASVFVNPTQFNDKADLERYPRTPEADCAMLQAAGCDVVFMPTVQEMYPEEDTRQFNFGSLETVMEGKYRPGHFNGVAQIVSKLFDAVQPHKAYFGEKDFQQVAIIRAMVEQLNYPIQIIACPIIREESGLARSSRNTLLTDEQRKKAALIAQVLTKSTTFVHSKSVSATIDWVEEQFKDDAEFRMDYYEIVDGNSLQPVQNWEDSEFIVGCIAVYCGKIRLIDNIHYKG